MFNRRLNLAPEMVTIPAGVLQMGSTRAAAEAAARQFAVPLPWLLKETLPHQVELPAFAISRAPVTCADYLAFIVATDHPTPAYWGGDDPPANRRDHPVVEVSFDDARTYCRWLSTAVDRPFRLPSEAQWERAARGDDQRIFPWGDLWDASFCNTAAGGPGSTTVVGSFAADTSPFGCVDLAGNVEEWTASRFMPYPQAPTEADSTAGIVVRGGSWHGPPDLARCARRHGAYRVALSATRGFRVVCLEA